MCQRKTIIVVEEEETDWDKSHIDELNGTDVTGPINEDDESVVILRPMSSKKSKSLENINKNTFKNKLA